MSDKKSSREGQQDYRTWMQKMLTGEVPPPPIAQLIGFTMVEMRDDGAVVFELETDPARHGNPMGTLHGGVLCDLGDAAMGTAIAVALEPGESFTTLELDIHFLKPIWKAKLVATARIVKKTKSLALLECDVVDQGGSLVARLASTCMVLRGEKAQGR